MEHRIRQLRKDRGLTLAELAARCRPATTAQTIGRLETGMRTLSLDWLARIADALDLPPTELLIEPGEDDEAYLAALLSARGAEALEKQQVVSLPRIGEHVRILAVTETFGDYRKGDLLWFETVALDRLHEAINADILLPGRAGAFHFGRLADIAEDGAMILPPSPARGTEIVKGFAWAARLRKLIRNFE